MSKHPGSCPKYGALPAEFVGQRAAMQPSRSGTPKTPKNDTIATERGVLGVLEVPVPGLSPGYGGAAEGTQPDSARERPLTSGVNTEPSEPRRPMAYPPEAVLTIGQVADWLQMSVRSVERLDLKCVYLGARTRRYLAKHVLDYLEGKLV